MSRALLGALILLVVSQPAAAKVPTFPASFQTKTVQNGRRDHLRTGWGPRARSRYAAWLRRYWRRVGPLAAVLAQDHTVIVPDLRGTGLSSHPEGG